MAIQIGSGGGDDDGVWWGMEQMPANSIQSSGVQSQQHSHTPRPRRHTRNPASRGRHSHYVRGGWLCTGAKACFSFRQRNLELKLLAVNQAGLPHTQLVPTAQHTPAPAKRQPPGTAHPHHHRPISSFVPELHKWSGCPRQWSPPSIQLCGHYKENIYIQPLSLSLSIETTSTP